MFTIVKTEREAWQEGADSVIDRDAVNPYDENTESELFEAWENGREYEEDRMGDEYAQYCDPSMRDLYE